MVIATVAAALVEQYESLVAQQSVNRWKSDVAGCGPHLPDKFIALAHQIPFRFLKTCPL
jgi:hypothetical protein